MTKMINTKLEVTVFLKVQIGKIILYLKLLQKSSKIKILTIHIKYISIIIYSLLQVLIPIIKKLQ